MNDSITMKGKYHFTIHGADGALKDEWTVDNLITSAGKAQLALLAGDATATPFTYLEVGTSSTAVAVGQTALQAAIVDSGLERAAGTVSRVTATVTNDTLQIVKAFSVTGSKTVEEAGIFNAASNGTMLGRALTGSKDVINGDTLTVTYQVIFA